MVTLLPQPAASPGFLLRQSGVRKWEWGKKKARERWELLFVDGLRLAGDVCPGRVSAWRASIVWIPPAGPVASSQPGHPGEGLWSREPCSLEPLSPSLLNRTPENRSRVSFVTYRPAFTSAQWACTWGHSWPLEESAGTLCAQCVPCGVGGAEHRLWRCLGPVLAEKGRPLHEAGFAKNAPPLTVLWPTGKAFMGSEWKAAAVPFFRNNRHSFMELAPLLETEREAHSFSVKIYFFK